MKGCSIQRSSGLFVSEKGRASCATGHFCPVIVVASDFSTGSADKSCTGENTGDRWQKITPIGSTHARAMAPSNARSTALKGIRSSLQKQYFSSC